jgi:hypothetical protein
MAVPGAASALSRTGLSARKAASAASPFGHRVSPVPAVRRLARLS